MRSALRSTRADENNRLAQIFDLLATAFHGPRVLRAVPRARDELRVFADRAFSVFDEDAIALALIAIVERRARRLGLNDGRWRLIARGQRGR